MIPRNIHVELKYLPSILCGMKFMSWNSRGIACLSFKRNLIQLVSNHHPDFVSLLKHMFQKRTLLPWLRICLSLLWTCWSSLGITLVVFAYCGMRVLFTAQPLRRIPELSTVLFWQTPSPTFLFAIYVSVKFKFRVKQWRSWRVLSRIWI